MSGLNFSAVARLVGEMLSTASQSILVPDWQRSYSWTSDEVDTFWADLERFDKAFPNEAIKSQQYFLGSVVLVTGGDEIQILDGQQRLATITILLSSIRDALLPLSVEAATALEQKYIAEKDFGTKASRYMLTLNHYDRDFYRQHVQMADAPTTDAKLKSHALIQAARQSFERKLRDLCNGLPADLATTRLLRVQRIVTNHLAVVEVSTPDEDGATSVFETLNDRGIGLSTPDLLRTLLMKRAPGQEEREAVVAAWGEIFAVLETGGVERFLRHYWVSIRGDVKTVSLYRDIKSTIERESLGSVQFSQELAEAAAAYKSLLDAADEDAAVARELVAVRSYGAAVLYPALLAGLAVRGEAVGKYAHYVRTLVVCFVRNSLIGNRESTKLEEAIYKNAVELRKHKDYTASAAEVASFAPSKSQFMAAFALVSVSRQASVKQLFREIELHLRATEELVLNSSKNVHLEHIYPQTPPADSRNPHHASIVNRLGNLTLLAARLNQGIRNAPFSEKREKAYSKSELKITEMLLASEADIWGEAEIDARQEELATLAGEVWAFNPEPTDDLETIQVIDVGVLPEDSEAALEE